jgi:hypothetical protein
MRRDIHKFLTGYTTVDSFPPQEKPAVAERAALAAGARDGADWAIVVTHGMGQQVHFETLEQIAVALRNAELRAQPGAAKPIVPRAVHLRNAKGTVTELVRAEMNVTGSDGQERTVHVYESYWAPLTEGQATLRDVTSFMAETFLRGLWFVTRYRGFNRWEFGGMQRYATRFFLSLGKLLAAILIFLLPLLLGNLLTVAQVYSLVRSGGTAAVIWEPYLNDLRWVVVFAAVFGFGALILPKLYRVKFLTGRAGFLRALRTGLKILAITISLAGLGLVFCAELLLFHHVGGPVMGWARYAVWAAVLAEGLIGRWFLIEYMGDVAIYATSFKVSRWDEVRGKIKKNVSTFRPCRPGRRRMGCGGAPLRRLRLLHVFLDVGDQSFGGEHQAGDGCGVLQSETSDLGRVDHASLDQVAVLAGLRVEAEVLVLRFAHAADDDAPSWPALGRSAASALRARASRC